MSIKPNTIKPNTIKPNTIIPNDEITCIFIYITNEHSISMMKQSRKIIEPNLITQEHLMSIILEHKTLQGIRHSLYSIGVYEHGNNPEVIKYKTVNDITLHPINSYFQSLNSLIIIYKNITKERIIQTKRIRLSKHKKTRKRNV